MCFIFFESLEKLPLLWIVHTIFFIGILPNDFFFLELYKVLFRYCIMNNINENGCLHQIALTYKILIIWYKNTLLFVLFFYLEMNIRILFLFFHLLISKRDQLPMSTFSHKALTQNILVVKVIISKKKIKFNGQMNDLHLEIYCVVFSVIQYVAILNVSFHQCMHWYVWYIYMLTCAESLFILYFLIKDCINC